MKEDDNEYMFGKAPQEEDSPTNKIRLYNEESYSKKLSGKDWRYSNAFKLIVGCLSVLGLIFLVDTIAVIAFEKTSETTNSIIEIVKTLLFTLSGYLFAREENKD